MDLGPLLGAMIPVFAIMLIGFVATASTSFRETLATSVNDFVYYIALPALLYESVAKATLSLGIPVDFLFVNTIAVLAIYGLGILVAVVLFRRELAIANAVGLVTSWGNVAYLGIPLLAAVRGPGTTFPAAIASLVHNLLCIAIFLIFATAAEQRQDGGTDVIKLVTSVVRRVVINPIFLSVAVGLIVALTHIPVPQPIDKTISLLAPIAAPGGLFALGVMLRSAVHSLREGHMPLAEIGLSVAIKLAVMPIVAFVLVKFVFSMPPVWATVTVVMAALPNAATVFVLTQQYKTYVQESTAAVVASTAGALLTLPLALGLLPI